MTKTGLDHPMGPGLRACVLGSDERGSSQIVRDAAGQSWCLNIMEGRILRKEALSLIAARTIAGECGRRLGW